MFKYRNIKTNEIVDSKIPIKDKNYILINWIQNIKMKASKIIKK